jgi:hypothetical protein
MSDSYHLNLRDISLEEYKRTLAAAELIPSRRLLKQEIDERFSRLKAQGISNLDEFVAAVKSNEKIAELSSKTDLPVEYLTLLRREVNALLPKPRNLRDFPGIEAVAVDKLAAGGIRNSKQLFERTLNADQRTRLARQVGMEVDSLLEIVKLSDLSRIYGVGPVFARLLYEAGVESVEAVARADAPRLFDKLAKAYLAAGNARVDFKERDIAFCIQMARRLPRAIIT